MARLDRYSIWVFNGFEQYIIDTMYGVDSMKTIMNNDLISLVFQKLIKKKTLERYLN